MNNSNGIPFFLKASIFFVGLWAFLTMLYLARAVIIPLVFSACIAIMINPMVNFFQYRLRLHQIIAIFLGMFITFLLMIGVMSFLYYQIMMFRESWPAFGGKVEQLITQFSGWASSTFHLSNDTIRSGIETGRQKLMENSLTTVTTTLTAVGSVVAFIFLLPVFVFLFLFYKQMFITFVVQAVGAQNKEHVSEVILGTKTIIQSYLNGLVIEAIIVAILNSIGLLILGIEYAILLGVLGAILNTIPYIGGVIAILVTMMIAFLTKTPIYMVYVVISYLIVQFIDNQIIFPRIVGSKVEINALVSIVAVLAGGLFWGIAGMFLSLPLVAVIKIIFDRIEGLKPWGMVLGNIIPTKPVYLSRYLHHSSRNKK
ncbi:MAG: AI-2E family transporter [Syntrophothermus sp.]